ncbi:MAG: hypothetical protein JSS91_00875 [Bacteroidetes bacterium]|nr:hypothetical protein [Bacteroidota bacterium]
MNINTGILKICYLLAVGLIFVIIEMGYRDLNIANEGKTMQSYVLPKNEDKELVKPDEVRQYVGAIAEREGLNVDRVDRVVRCESRFDPKIESKTGKFKGLWQIGSMHEIADSCKLDTVCSTKWAVEKIKNDKSMGAWECDKLTLGL